MLSECRAVRETSRTKTNATKDSIHAQCTNLRNLAELEVPNITSPDGIFGPLRCKLALHADDGVPRKAYDILRNNCFACHGQSKTSGLDLRTRDAMLKGGWRGPALTPANTKRSFIFTMASHAAEPSMPPGKKLPDEYLTGLETSPRR